MITGLTLASLLGAMACSGSHDAHDAGHADHDGGIMDAPTSSPDDGSRTVPDGYFRPRADGGPVMERDGFVPTCDWSMDLCAILPGQVCIVGTDVLRGSDDPAFLASQPEQRVTVPNFGLDPTEVTVGQYQECVALGFCTVPYAKSDLGYYRTPANRNKPVVGLSWDQMTEYCAYRGGVLPSEAQWELAARGPESYLGRYTWGDDRTGCAMANWADCSSGPADVGSYPMDSGYRRALDLIGNVAEATSDRWEPSYSRYPDMTCDPHHPPRSDADASTVVRGCSWRSQAATPAESMAQCTGFFRRPLARGTTSSDVGFRCASR